MRQTLCWTLFLVALAGTFSTARADARDALLVHVPPARLLPGEPVYSFSARFRGSWSGDSLELCARTAGSTEYEVFPFLGERENMLVARVDGRLVRPPGLEYYLRSVDEGTEVERFGKADTPHRVIVDPTPGDQRHDARLERHGGRRTEFSARFRHTNFGSTRQTVEQAKPGTKLRLLPDNFNEFEAAVRYSFLQDAIYAISFGYGMLGGVLGTETPPLAAYDAANASAALLDAGAPTRPGLYYGFGTAYWEFADRFAVEGKVIMGASYRGFEGGGGLLARIGSVRGTHFDMAIEGVSHVGFRFITEFQWSTLPYFRMSLRNVVTDYPFGEEIGVEPSYNVTLVLDAFELSTSLGYGARKGYESGGFCVGGGLVIRL